MISNVKRDMEGSRIENPLLIERIKRKDRGSNIL